jgi:imidazole glycerol-phosphate synthase subunit HisF
VGLTKRIIPTILIRGRTLVKGARFDGWRAVGVAAQAARIHSMRGVDEIVMLDIEATARGRGPDVELVRELSASCFTPLAVGGGITTMDQIQALLNAGADKVVLGASILTSDLLERASARYGKQALVASVDARGQHVTSHNAKQDWPMGPKHFAMLCEDWGAGEILLNDVTREGTLQGYNLDLIREVSAAVDIPVVAACGAGTYEHMREAIEAGADAVAAGAVYQFTDATPAGAAQYLRGCGIEVRI